MEKGEKVIAQKANGNQRVKGIYIRRCIRGEGNPYHLILNKDNEKVMVTQPQKI